MEETIDDIIGFQLRTFEGKPYLGYNNYVYSLYQIKVQQYLMGSQMRDNTYILRVKKDTFINPVFVFSGSKFTSIK